VAAARLPDATATLRGAVEINRVAGTTVNSANAAAADVQVTATATCTSGLLLGGGGTVTTSDLSASKVQMLSSYPSSATVWTVIGVVNTALSGGKNMSVTAYAICSQ
jgi:hypothetical protein